MSNRQLAARSMSSKRPASLDGQATHAFSSVRKPELVSCPEPISSVAGEFPPGVATTSPGGGGRSSWSTTFGYLMEGFLLYGASLHPNGTFPVGLLQKSLRGDPGGASAMDASAPGRFETRHACGAAGLVPGYGGAAPGIIGRIGRTVRGSVGGLWARWRRERAIRKTVAALADLDDRTLRDMGIPGRSRIEEVVRYCRDC